MTRAFEPYIEEVGSKHRRRYWVPTVNAVTVTVAQSTVRLAPKGTYHTRFSLVADRSNTTYIAVGSANLVNNASARPNGAYAQLDPGRIMHVWTDHPDDEQIDLGDFYVATASGTTQQFMYVVTWSYRWL